MSLVLKDKTAKILIVDNAASTRRMRIDILNAVGFTKVEAVENLNQALEKMQEQPFDWLITPMLEGSKPNGLNFVQLCEKHSQLRNMLVTILVDAKPNHFIYKAFELGMFTWFKNTVEKSIFKKEIDSILEGLAKENWDTTLFSSQNIRALLVEERRFDELLDFENTLSKYYANNGSVLMHLAFAQFQCKKNSAAHRTMKLAQVLDPQQQGRCIELTQLFGKEEDAASADMNPLGIKLAYIVDPDEKIGNTLIKTLFDLGVQTKWFQSGDKAWEEISKNPEPSLILTEWKLSGVPAPVLIQKIRSHGFTNVPIVVVSKDIDESDLLLLREMEVAEVLKKPIETPQVLAVLAKISRQVDRPANPILALQNMRKLLLAGKNADAEKARDEAISNRDFPIGWRHQITGEFLFYKNDFTGSKQAALNALKSGGEVVLALNLMGKCFMKLRDFDNAKKCLENAQFLSPFSIERLCQMAEVNSELGNHEEAKEIVADAKDIDSENKTVQETEAKVALNSGDNETAKQIMAKLDSLGNVIGFMNNRAVALARSGQLGDALNLYDGAVKTIPDSKPDILSQVKYNLSLAHLRGGKMDQAKAALDQCLAIEKNAVKQKAEALRNKLVTAMGQGKTLSIAAAPPPSVATDPKTLELTQQIMGSLRVKPGDRCCYLIFISDKTKEDDRLKPLLENVPNFEAKYSV